MGQIIQLIDSNTKENVNYEEVTTWYDGSIMDETKVDNYVYRKAGNKYYKLGLPALGEKYLKKDTMEEMRNLSASEIVLLKIGYYKGVELHGYYEKGDTPSPIVYSISSAERDDDGGSIIQIGNIKVEHSFLGEVNVKYFGTKGDGVTDDTVALQNAFDFIAGRKKTLNLENLKFLVSDTIHIRSGSHGCLIAGLGSYMYSHCEIISNTPDKPIVRSWSQGISFKNIQLSYTTKANSNVALLLKLTDETTDETLPDDQVAIHDWVNNIDSVIEGCSFFNCGTGIEAWGRQLFIRNNQFSTIDRGIVLKQLNTKGLYGGAARAYRIYGNSIHASNSPNKDIDGFIVNETQNGYGFHIVGNFSDSFGTFFVGDLIDSVMVGNHQYHLTGYGIYSNNIRNTLISSNAFMQEDKYRDETGFVNYSAQSAIVCNNSMYRTNIVSNMFPPCIYEVIKSASTILCTISQNQFRRWGIAGGDSKIAISLDKSADGGSKSRATSIYGNKFYQSYVQDSYIIETYSYYRMAYGNDNELVLEAGATVTTFKAPNTTFKQTDAATTSLEGLVKQSTAVLNVASADATDLASALTLVNELKSKLNAKLQADRTSGQQAT